MVWFNIRLTLRSLRSNLLYSLITILGLAVGMAATILLFIYVQHEFSYDKFNTRAPRIYRMVSILGQDKSWTLPICTRFSDSTFASQIPEVDQVVQFYAGGSSEVVVNNQRFKDLDLLYTDPNIAKVFTLNFLDGNSETALTDPSSMVVTDVIAQKLFGTKNVVGKTLTMDNKLYTITAVIKALPSTSHFSIELLIPINSRPFLNQVRGLEFNTYILFKEGANIQDGIKKCEALYSKQLADRFSESGYTTGCFLQKLTDIHLHSSFYSRLEKPGSITRVYVYFVLALLILSIAIINFINLLTVQYEGKTKDIGVQKALGASRMTIVKQFMGKSLTFSFIALIIAAIMVEFTISGFGALVNSNLIVSYTGNPWLILLLPALAAMVGIVSGIYPAFYLSRFSTIKVLKGAVNRSRGTNQFTRTLVVFQFAVAIALISCITVIYMQISFMKSVDLGFHPANVVGVSNLNRKLIRSYPAIKDALLKIPEITTVSAADHFPGGGASGEGIRVVGADADLSINSYRVQPDYFKVLQIHFLIGRPFQQSASADSNAIILNEVAVRKLGITNPLTTDILYDGERVNIVGVVKNFNYASLKEPIEPLAFTHNSFGLNFFLVRIANGQLKDGIKAIEKVLKQFDPGYDMEYKLVDDFCRNRYNSEEQTVELTTYASLLTLLLALLGLYALTMFIVNKRTKEIGIRKVMGSTRMQVVAMLIGIFVKWITVAFIISTPVAYYIMQRWLQNYAYHISLSIWPFLMAGLVALLIAVLTVGWQAFKAASRNPIEALRYE